MRDLAARYRGSVGGLLWTLVQPALMLAIYTLVFGQIFVQRGVVPGSTGFVFNLFLGLILHSFLGETLSRAPGVIISQPSYVKKVLFPLELLPLVVVCSAAIQSALSAVLLVSVLGVTGGLHWTVVLSPLAWFPLLIMALGVALGISALTVFLRDLAQLTGLLSTALLFLGPVFFRFQDIPAALQSWLILNPITVPIETARALIIDGALPPIAPWLAHFVASCMVYFVGTWLFNKTRRAFADVL